MCIYIYISILIRYAACASPSQVQPSLAQVVYILAGKLQTGQEWRSTILGDATSIVT